MVLPGKSAVFHFSYYSTAIYSFAIFHCNFRTVIFHCYYHCLSLSYLVILLLHLIPAVLYFYCTSYPLGGHQLELLKNVTGFFEPGTLTALMGSSGAGTDRQTDLITSFLPFSMRNVHEYPSWP